MKQAGKSFIFEYPDFTVRVHYISATQMEWEQTRGPVAGTKGTEEYHAVEVRPDVYLLSWQEKDAAVISQVVDFGRQKVYTNYISPEKVIFRMSGTVRPSGSQ